MPRFENSPFKINSVGAVDRTLADRLADRPSFLEFGAVPDGVTNCSPALVAAINASLPAFSGAGYGSVWVPRGMYKFNSVVPVPPGVSIIGEGSTAVQFLANFNGYVLDSGATPFTGLGPRVEGIEIYNYNNTPFTSGAVRLGGRCPVIHGCMLHSMVSANFQNAVAPRISDSACFNNGNISMGGDPGVGAVGINMACFGGVVDNVYFSNVDVCIGLSGAGMVVQGTHYEVCRRNVVAGYGAVSGGGVLGLGYLKGFVYQAGSGEAIGIMLDIEGPTLGTFYGGGGQLHAGGDINPEPSDVAYKDLAKHVIRIRDGCALGVKFVGSGGGTADFMDPAGSMFKVGMPPSGNIRTGGCVFVSTSCDSHSSTPIPIWTLPGSAGGGAAVAGAANCARWKNCDIGPVWQYNDLPWGTLVGATISNGSGGSGIILNYSSATRLTLEVGAVLKRSGITAGTRVTKILSSTSAEVDITQNATSGTATFYCNNPGDDYQISDSVDPLWTGSVSNGGKPITTGGGSNRVTIMFKETDGYAIVG